MSIESVMPSNHLILCHPLPLLPSIFPSIRVFSSELALLIRWPKYWSFSFNISPDSSEYSRLISFRMNWFDQPCHPRDSQESSPAPQFKGINSLMLSLLCCSSRWHDMLFLQIFSSNSSLNVTFLKIPAWLMEKKVEEYLLEIFNMKTYLYTQIRGENNWLNNNVIPFVGIFIKESPTSKTQKYERFHCFIIWLRFYIDCVWGMLYTFTFKKIKYQWNVQKGKSHSISKFPKQPC